jgi:hypothetical protein
MKLEMYKERQSKEELLKHQKKDYLMYKTNFLNIGLMTRKLT